MFARISKDIYRSKWNFLSRTDPDNPDVINLSGRQAPETSRYFGGASRVTLPQALIKKVESMNTADGNRYLEQKGSGWVNAGPWPRVEQLSFACNVVDVVKRQDGRNYVRYVDMAQPAPDGNYITIPYLYHVFTVVRPDGVTVLPAAGGIQQGIYLLGQVGFASTSLWYPDDALEFFPALPFNAVLIVAGLNVRDAPAGNILRSIHPSDTPGVTIYEYVPRGSAVWGRIGVSEWVALAHPAIAGWYSTTWNMKNPPPPVV